MSKKEILNWLKPLSLVFAMALTFSGCANLDEDPSVRQLAPGAYTQMEELELGVTGIYGRLRNASQWSTFFVHGWAGDDITTHRVSNKADFREFDQRVVSANNGRIASNWRDVYAMVRAANSVIESSAELEFSGAEDQAKRDRLVGETYFLRGVMFFHLARMHGRIPLPLASIPDFNIGLATQEEVYQQIESDLLRAETLLPTIYPNVAAGAPRPNSGSARAFLARLYLDWAGFPAKDASKYADAASSAKQVIDNATTHGFGLVDDLEDLWALSNRFNNESLWTIAYNRANGLNNRKFGKLGNPSDLAGWQETFAEIRFFEDFPEGPRKEATYRTEHDWENFSDQPTPVFKKITGPAGDIPLADFNTDRNDFVMRYAELLLIYAEASGRSGNVTPEAWEALNKIRRRAAGLPYDTADGSVDVTSGDIAELAFTERKWELAGEWLRWNDLVRMERVQDALSNRDPQSSFNSSGQLLSVQNPILGSLGTDNYFAPIPQNEVDLNPNLAN